MKCFVCNYEHNDESTNDPFGLVTICNIEGDNFNIFGVKNGTPRSITSNALYACPRCGSMRVSDCALWGTL